MSNKTQLQTNNTKLDSLIQTLQGKAAGGSGGNIETCRVVIKSVASDLDDPVNAPNTGSSFPQTSIALYEDGSILSRKIIENDPYYISGEGIVFNSVIKGSILTTYNNGGFAVSEGLHHIKSENPTGWSKIDYYTVNDDGVLATWICFVRDTMILLADNTTKPIQDITYSDYLLVWDFDNGCYTSAKPIWIKKTQMANKYYRCEFEDGTILNLVGSDGNCHRVFSVDDGAFVYATECIGKNIMTRNGVTKLLSCDAVDEEVEFYNIITNHHLNLFAEGVLTSCRLNNIYSIIDMKFVKDGRPIRPYEAYQNVDIEFYKGLRLGEQTGDISELNDYVHRLYALRKETI